MTLTNPTDDELNMAFSETVAGIGRDDPQYDGHDYLADADSMLPFFAQSNGILEFDGHHVSAECEGRAGWKDFSLTNEVGCDATAWQGVRCMCIALLLSRGIEVEFT